MPPERAAVGRYQRVALELAALDKWDYEEALRRILRLDADTLGVERVNFWLLEDDPRAIRCEAFWIRSSGPAAPGLRLPAADYPRYFAALREEKIIDAGDAAADPRTSEFADSYLAPLGIGAMMDVPVWSGGRLAGVLCHEHVGPPRPWTEQEKGLALAMAQALATTLEVRERRRTDEQVRARDEFLSVASHELYTPLTSLQLAVDTLRNRQPATRELELIDRQVRRLTELVTRLLDVSRIQGGRLEPVREDCDLAELVREIADRFAPLLVRAGCDFTVDAPESLRGYWDRGHLDQVITNLLSNAVKFAPGRPVSLTVTAADDGARLVVSDRGIGIPSDRLPRIFQRFERAVPVRSYGGLGLGLYIVRAIVEAHGGRVDVASAVDQGTTVTIDLPRRSLA